MYKTRKDILYQLIPYKSPEIPDFFYEGMSDCSQKIRDYIVLVFVCLQPSTELFEELFYKTHYTMNTRLLFIILISLNFSLYSQTEISYKEYDINLNADIGHDIYALKNNGEKLPEGDYVVKKTKRSGKKFAFYFSISNSGEIDGNVYLKYGHDIEGVVISKIQVKNGVVKKYRLFDLSGKHLRAEGFFKGDTIVTREYTNSNLLTYEIKELKGEYVYKYECDAYNYPKQMTDSLGKCVKTDYVTGVEDEILNGKILTRKRTKNIPEDIESIIDIYDSTDENKRIIYYINRVKKTIKKDGSYEIEERKEGSYLLKKYNKKGELIKSDHIILEMKVAPEELQEE